MEVVFRPNENLCLLAALWRVANGEQKKLMTNGGETNVIDVSACFVFDLFELKMDVKV